MVDVTSEETLNMAEKLAKVAETTQRIDTDLDDGTFDPDFDL